MQFIGIDVHKRIFTACILDENEKVVGEIIDAPTTEKGLDGFMRQYPPEDRLSFSKMREGLISSSIIFGTGVTRSMSHSTNNRHCVGLVVLDRTNIALEFPNLSTKFIKNRNITSHTLFHQLFESFNVPRFQHIQL